MVEEREKLKKQFKLSFVENEERTVGKRAIGLGYVNEEYIIAIPELWQWIELKLIGAEIEGRINQLKELENMFKDSTYSLKIREIIQELENKKLESWLLNPPPIIYEDKECPECLKIFNGPGIYCGSCEYKIQARKLVSQAIKERKKITKCSACGQLALGDSGTECTNCGWDTEIISINELERITEWNWDDLFE